MTEETVRVEFQGEMVEAIRMEVVSQTEPWNQYVLSDGFAIRTKSMLVEVLKLKGKQDSDGKPIYSLRQVAVLEMHPAKHSQRSGQ